MMESGRDTVDIHGIEAETMDLLLDFMYTCSIVISVENVQQVLQGASLLGLTSLRNMCAHFLQSRLTPSNCLGEFEWRQAHAHPHIYMHTHLFLHTYADLHHLVKL